MTQSLKRLTSPTETAVTIQEAMKHLRVVTTEEEELDYIASLVKAAEQYCESYCRRQLVVADFACCLDAFPFDGWLTIQKSPMIEVTEIKYFDIAGTEQTLDEKFYEVDAISEPARIRFKNPPQTADKLNTICIKFSAGYAKEDKTFDATLVPKQIKQAMFLIVGHLYEHREQVLVGVPQTEIDFGVDQLLDTERIWIF